MGVKSSTGSLPPTRALVAFEATVRLGSMTAAAKELGTTQPAISQQIRALEEAIGGSLLDRHAGSLIPNSTGLQFYAQLSASLAGLHAAVDHARATVCNVLPTITITANFGFTHLWLLPRLPALREAFAQVQIHVSARDAQMLAAHQDSDIDISFGQRHELRDTAFLLAQETVFPVCSPDYAQRHGLAGHLSQVDAAELTFLNMDASNPRWLDWPRWAKLAGLGDRRQVDHFTFNNYPLLLNAACQGDGIALGWDILVQPMIERGALVRLGPDVCRSAYGYVLSTRHKNNSLIDPIVAWLKTQIAS